MVPSTDPVPPLRRLDGASDELETLARRLLELLGRVTGLESTYLTSIDWDGALQQVLYARNVGSIEIPEGLSVEWSDTLCRRALEGGPTCTSDVPTTYPDSAAALELGLRTYVTVPVRSPDGAVFGTVCGADSRRVEVSEDAQAVMEALAEMVALQLANDAARRELEATNAALAELAYLDGLTGLGNRRALDRELPRACAGAQPTAVIAVDVDHFKQINDALGHAAGDEVLHEVSRRLVARSRSGDSVARLGGDEFVAILPGADLDVAIAAAERLRADVSGTSIDTVAGPVHVTLSVGVASGVDEPATALLQRADEALYEAKAAGRDAVRAAT